MSARITDTGQALMRRLLEVIGLIAYCAGMMVIIGGLCFVLMLSDYKFLRFFSLPDIRDTTGTFLLFGSLIGYVGRKSTAVTSLCFAALLLLLMKYFSSPQGAYEQCELFFMLIMLIPFMLPSFFPFIMRRYHHLRGHPLPREAVGKVFD